MKKKNGLANVNGTYLYYEVAGSGEPLVLVHGATLNTQEWDEQFFCFADQYTVIRYDSRGYGKSSVPKEKDPYSHADDLKALLGQLGISKTHLLGHSMGGRLAIRFTLAYPDSVRSLGLAASSLDGHDWATQSDKEALQEIGKMYQAGKRKSALELLLDHPVFKPATENPDIRFRLIQIWAEYSGWHFTHTDPVIPPQPPAAERLDEIEVPTLVIIGELDAPGLLDTANLLASNIKDARKVVLSGVGHMPSMEAPRRFNDAVLSFLAEVRKGFGARADVTA